MNDFSGVVAAYGCHSSTGVVEGTKDTHIFIYLYINAISWLVVVAYG